MSLHGTRSGEESLQVGPESVKSEPPLGPVEVFLYLWFRYETGIKPTPLGVIYGADHTLDNIRRKLDVRSCDERLQAYHDAQNFWELKRLYRMGFIDAAPEIIAAFKKSDEEG